MIHVSIVLHSQVDRDADPARRSESPGWPILDDFTLLGTERFVDPDLADEHAAHLVMTLNNMGMQFGGQGMSGVYESREYRQDALENYGSILTVAALDCDEFEVCPSFMLGIGESCPDRARF